MGSLLLAPDIFCLRQDIRGSRGPISSRYTCTRAQIKDWAGRTSTVDTAVVVEEDEAGRVDDESTVGVARIRRHKPLISIIIITTSSHP